MAYIDLTYYKQDFNGSEIPDSDFPRIAERASDIIDSVVQTPITAEVLAEHEKAIKKATAYQADYLYCQGGEDAINGISPIANGESESLDGYSISANQQSMMNRPTVGGIPVSPMALAWLRKTPLMQRCVFADRISQRYGH
jgi:hypothetical protein